MFKLFIQKFLRRGAFKLQKKQQKKKLLDDEKEEKKTVLSSI